ncbi:MAG: hypothetical protein WC548_00215 [Candidatus Pacearchaeota archaeon]
MTKGLYSLFLRRLSEIKSRKEIIPFPMVFSKLCSCFSITKAECWEILFLLRDVEFIEIIRAHGVKILNKDYEERNISESQKYCISKCSKCNKNFRAKIAVRETCNECEEKWKDELENKVKKRLKDDEKNGFKNPEWIIKLQEIMKEKGNEF